MSKYISLIQSRMITPSLFLHTWQHSDVERQSKSSHLTRSEADGLCVFLSKMLEQTEAAVVSHVA